VIDQVVDRGLKPLIPSSLVCKSKRERKKERGNGIKMPFTICFGSQEMLQKFFRNTFGFTQVLTHPRINPSNSSIQSLPLELARGASTRK
jgi:hypothetical protein